MGKIEEVFDKKALAELSVDGSVFFQSQRLEPQRELERICNAEGSVGCERRNYFSDRLDYGERRFTARRDAEELREILRDGLAAFEPVLPHLNWGTFTRTILASRREAAELKKREIPADLLQLYLNALEHRESLDESKFVEMKVTFRRQAMAETMESVFTALLISRQFEKAQRIASTYKIGCRNRYETHPRLGLLREAILDNRKEGLSYLKYLIEVQRHKAAPNYKELPLGVITGDSKLVLQGLKRTNQAYQKAWNTKTYATPRVLRQYGSVKNILEDIRIHLQNGWLLSPWAIAWLSLAWHRGMKDVFTDVSRFSEWVPWELCCPESRPADSSHAQPKPKSKPKKLSQRAQRDLLFVSIAQGDLDAVRPLIDTLADLNVRNRDRRTPLMEAAHGGQIAIARLLLRSNANPDLLDVHGRSVLGIAASRGDLKMVDLILKEGIQPDHAGKPYRPLADACATGHLKVVKCLLKAGADPTALNDNKNSTPLVHAIDGEVESEAGAYYVGGEFMEPGGDYVGIVRELLKHGAKPNVRLATEGNGTALHSAAVAPSAEKFVKLLLASGAKVNVQDEYLNTPLHNAVECGKTAAVRLLLAAGAKKSLRNKDKKTAYDLAKKLPKIRKLLG